MTTSQKYQPRIAASSAWHDVRGVKYHVREWGERSAAAPGRENGDKPMLVLLHGWGDCSASFQFLADELGDDWYLVAPDWRGFGLSRMRCQGYWFPDYLADLDVLLSIYQPHDAVHLLGHSMGANAAGLYAGIFPERVRSFVNVEGFGLADGDPANAPQHYRRWIEQSRTMPEYTSYRSFDELAERIIRRSPTLGLDRARFVAQHWASRRDDGRIVLHADPAHKLPNAVQYRRAEAEACWSKVTAPVLLVAGEQSDFTAALKSWLDPDESRQPFQGARTVVIPGARHMVHFERPGELAAAIRAFHGGLQDPVV